MPLGGAMAQAEACQIKKTTGRGCLSPGQRLQPRHVKSRKTPKGMPLSGSRVFKIKNVYHICGFPADVVEKDKSYRDIPDVRSSSNLTGISQMFAAFPTLQ